VELGNVPVLRLEAGTASLGGFALAPGESAEVRPGDSGTAGDVVLVFQRSGDGGAPLESSRDLGDHDVTFTPKLAPLLDTLKRLAPGDLTVLVLGETGVGKDVFAELVHRASPRARAPFVRIHGAALSPRLFESELFGHEKGAFTGASTKKRGLLDVADGGTVLLDEIGEISKEMQVKLLRVLEDRRVLPVGGTRPHTVDVRFVAATNRDLEAEVRAGRFREDLYFRLSGATLRVPPLRERADDVLVLARRFLARASNGQRHTFDTDAEAALLRHPFPGNVRELRLTVERAAALADGATVREPDLALEPLVPETTQDAVDLLAVLDACAGNQSEAARRLGMPRRTFAARVAALRPRH
jgi:transcriptional regulator with GAF, ATPase, and Fis domain